MYVYMTNLCMYTNTVSFVGTGRGGESMWKDKFEDEFDSRLTHRCHRPCMYVCVSQLGLEYLLRP
jgi:hypothetical protein